MVKKQKLKLLNALILASVLQPQFTINLQTYYNGYANILNKKKRKGTLNVKTLSYPSLPC